MVFGEEQAGWLLIIHAVLGIGTVGATTHLALWLRAHHRGRPKKIAATRRFALLAFAFYASTFVFGNLVYPAYKFGVREVYLEDGAAIARDLAADRERRNSARARHLQTRELYPEGPRAPIDEAPTLDPAIAAKRAARVARWFDVKEHWSALGLALCAACLLVLLRWTPARDPRVITGPLYALAAVAAAITWLSGIIGLVTSSFRAV